MNELIASTKDRTITIEEFVTLRLKVLSLFDDYNRQLYKGTTLDYHPPTPTQVKKEVTETPKAAKQTKQAPKQHIYREDASSGPKKRGRPKLDHNRECYNCQSTETSEWRSGPYPNTYLCNKCGLKLLKKKKKENETGSQAITNGTQYTQN